jgi:hypothetical protein
MKITVNQLRRIIKEEISKSLNENEVDVREEVKHLILSHENEIEALLKDPTRTDESYSALMKPIVDEIKKQYGDEGIAAYNSLIQTDLKDLLAFSYPPGYRSPKESPSEPEDVSNRRYLDYIGRR